MAMNGNDMGDAVLAAINALPAAQRSDPQASLRAMCSAIVAHIKANATVTIKSTDAGLQTSTAAGSATNGPASSKTLPAGCIG